ncbi:unnamed protein product [Symbiodinium natans]|uniref:Uncharacterized protein n=1 Tax=Symbiodinium natans TaxID=878477 RepID=A0A812NVM6_9DINO|nr:unnamed protein product [Symbiodinium natans]
MISISTHSAKGGHRGPGLYQVDPFVTSLHNIRAAPSVFSPIVGTLEAYDVIEVAQTIQLCGQDGCPEFWAQLLRKTAGPAPWILMADADCEYLVKLLRSGEALKKPEDWVPPLPDETPYGEATQSVNFYLAAALGDETSDLPDMITALADHECRLGREAAALAILEEEANSLREEARAYERELERRRGDRAATQRRFQRLKQREAWNIANAQIELQLVQVEDMLDDAMDNAEAACASQLALQRAREREEAERESEAQRRRRKKAISRLGAQLAASVGEDAEVKKLEVSSVGSDSKLLEAMAGLETLVGRRYLQGGAALTSLEAFVKIMRKL